MGIFLADGLLWCSYLKIGDIYIYGNIMHVKIYRKCGIKIYHKKVMHMLHKNHERTLVTNNNLLYEKWIKVE